MSSYTACDMDLCHIGEVTDIEKQSFKTPWPREAFIMEIQNNKRGKYRVITLDNKVIAYGGLWIYEDMAHITNIAVHPDYRGKGLGNLILEDLIAYTKARDISSIFLEVRVSNIKAIRLYEKYNFKQIDIKQGYYVDTGEDGIIMQCMVK